MKTLYAFAAFPSMLVAALALADNPGGGDNQSSTSRSSYESTSNGGSVTKEKAESTDANGTVTTQESTKKVDVDSKGNTTTKVDVKDTTDPKGLFNKQTTEIKNKAIQKDGKTEYRHKKTVNGTEVEDSEEKKQPAQ
jgi:hypothetical protein